VIVLLTDGRTTTGPDPLEAAHTAADRGVRVFTVGFGTPQGANVGFEGGWSIFMRFDEATLKSVADITKGEYFYAGSAEDLKKIYDSLTARLVLERKETEVGALFSALAALLAAVAGGLSVVWFNRLG
jgi:Ca-activated chloride channel family protein